MEGANISRGAKLGLSGFILFHLMAVLVGPWSTPARPGAKAPPVATDLARLLRPYLELTHLNAGYRFFAPDPPAGTMRLRFDIELPSGQQSQLFLPTSSQWPRLRYHRHFMLCERHLESPAWTASYCEHLGRKHAARRVTLYHQRVQIRTMPQALSGMAADDSTLVSAWVPVTEWTPDP